MNTNRIIFTCLSAVGAIALALGSRGVSAQTDYPSRPIRLVISFPAGSGQDQTYRRISELFAPILGQPVLIDNRPGGGSMVAALFAKDQAPDGYTFIIASNAMTIKSVTNPDRFDIRKDFTPVSPSNRAAMIIAVNKDQVKATTLKELIAEAKSKPGQINFASYGVGSGAHLLLEIMMNDQKFNMTHVPYQGSVQATTDTASGRTQVTAGILATARPFVKEYGGADKLRLIAVALTERSSVVPNIPAMREIGFPQFDLPIWAGYIAPKGLPNAIVEKMNRAVNFVSKLPEITQLNERIGVESLGGQPEDLAKMIDREYNAYRKVITEANLKLE